MTGASEAENLEENEAWESGDTPATEAPTEGWAHNLIRDSIRRLHPPPPLVLAPQDSVAQAIRLMQQHNHGSVYIQSQGKLIGIFTEWDVIAKVIGIIKNPDQHPIAQVMTPDPTCIDIDDPVAVAFHKLAIGGYHHLPVLEKDRLVGFVSSRGLLAYIAGRL